MKPICFYHKADLDGVCSAAIVKHFVPDCELYGLDHGDEFPWMKAVSDIPCKMDGTDHPNTFLSMLVKGGKRTVYMVDFSLPPADMERLATVSNLVWCDHHKMAIDACADLRARGMRDTSRAACELAWAWFDWTNPGEASDHYRFDEVFDDENPSTLPEAVYLLGRYDVFDDTNPEWESKALPFQYGMRSALNIYDPCDFTWRFLLDCVCPDTAKIVAEHIGRITSAGCAILRYQAEVNRKACEAGAFEFALPEFPIIQNPANYGMQPVEGWKTIRTDGRTFRVLACNTIVFNSQFFDGFFDPEKHDVMCAYAQMSDGRWKVSLYSTKDTIDVGVIAKTFGGGGHKGAAGFVCNKLPWEVE